jgi:protein-S-isoprenylcysteine O-methyltransferase Ste14
MVEQKKLSLKYVVNNLIRFLGLLILSALLLFVSAGTFAYWQGWIFLGAFGVAIAAFMAYGMLRDPNMLKERSQKAKNVKHWDTVILNIYTVFLVIMVVLAPLDGGRFHWSHVSVCVNMLGLGLMIPSFALLMWVTVTNTYLSRYVRIQDDRGHQVVTSGPYRFVRHPMYASNILFFPSIPLLLGSWWALIPAVIIMGLFTLRTYLEDKTLQAELPGYKEYAMKTRYRMVPGIW